MAELRGNTFDHGADWADFKQWVDGTYAALTLSWCENADTYTVAVQDGAFTRIVGMNKGSDDALDFESVWKLSRPHDKQDAGGVKLTALAVPMGKETIQCSHDYSRPTTWWSNAVRVEDETLSHNVGTGWYESDNANWIDMYHGLVFDERALRADYPHQFTVVVKVDGVTKTARAPFAAAGGDYEIDYVNGKVKPFTEDWSAAAVTADYSYATDSIYVLKPSVDRLLKIEDAEVQASNPIEMTDAIRMEVFGYVQFFAPQLMGPPFNLPLNYLIPIELTIYDTLFQVIDEAKEAYPEIPALGGTARGMTTPMQILKFKYGRMRKLYSCLGMEIRISLADDVPFVGDRMTATFYCASVIDPGPVVALGELSRLATE